MTAATAPALGVSFSHHHAAWLGLDPRETLRRLLEEVRVRHLRLSVHWHEIAPEPTRLDFSPLAPWLDLAARHDARVLMTLGLKAQRHPEFYPPEWLTGEHPLPHGADIAEHPRMVTRLLLMLERATAFLADHDIIDAWQVENEPFLPAAGRTVGWKFSPGLLEREIAVVRDSDPRNRPIAVNHSSQTAFDRWWLPALNAADVFAQNIYTRVPSRRAPWRYWNRHLFGPFAPALRRQALVARRLGKEFWVTELQAEPWENADLRRLESSAIGSISPERMRSNLELARRTTASRIYLWGAEWWCYMADKRGDGRYLALARELFGSEGSGSRSSIQARGL
ncbi:MAG: hypothetical protein HYX51_10750 [Chloroflexi bacterium]|nr:hypothetical protein [Chloroflexota bacterium]